MHLYAPASFEKAFPDFPGSIFKISYINNKAERVSVEINWSSYDKVFSYTPADAAKLFNYFLGYSAPVLFVYQEDFGIPPTRDYGVCFGDGVATSFTDYSGAVPYLDLFYRSECQARQYTFEDIKNHWARRFI